MKKRNKFLLMVVGALITMVCGTQNVFASTLNYDFSGYWYERNNDLGNYASWKLENYYVDGNVAYCIEPGIPEGNPMYQGSWENTGLSNDIKERVLLLSYYGYQYTGHQTTGYRAATQAMIWETILGHNAWVRFSTARYNGGNAFDVSYERSVIEDLVRHHYDKPSFNGGTYNLQVGETLTLTDTNNVLSNYNVSVDGANYTLNSNSITLTPTKSGNITMTFTKKQIYDHSYLIYYGDGIQNMISGGNVDPVYARINVNAYYGSVELNKSDKETGTPQGQASLKGAVYGVYAMDGTLLTKITTNESGYGKSDAVIPYGSYYIQEISPSTGYYLDNTRYNVDVKGKTSVNMNVTEEVIKNYISILKQYDYVDETTQFLNAESGITFEIYYPDNEEYQGKLYDTITTDKNGYATLEIPYGVWKFHQVNTNTGFEKIYDFYITVDENSSKEQYYNILNNKLSAYLQVFKTDLETGKTIALADITFKILNTDTNQYVSQYVGGKVYSEFKTDETGKFITYLKLEAGNYKLIETSSPKNYLLNTDGLEFTIGEGTYYNYTTYGAFITVYFKDQVIKGQIEINKTGESVVIDNNTFTYEAIPLDNVTYEIYANEDILSSDKTLVHYKKDQLVDTITTNSDGYAISKKLYLGNYYLVEVKTKDGYVLNSEKYEFTLSEKDNKTPIVYSSYSALNLLKKGTLEFTKTDLTTGDGIPNTKIEISHLKDDGTSEVIFVGTTDEQGKITITDLFVGKFTIIETEASTGYRLSDEVVTFEIKEDGEIVKANMTNEKITSTVKIYKVDEKGNPISGVEIGIFDLENNLLGKYVSDENGYIEVELEYGSYYYQELKAKDGYILNDEKVYFDVTEDGAIIESTLINEEIVEVPSTGLSSINYEVVGSLILIVSGLGLIGYVLFKKKRK